MSNYLLLLFGKTDCYLSMFDFFHKKSTPAQLPYQTDIHCHILPGIDDGSQSVEDSIALIRQMQSWGIRRIIATPHVTEETFENNADTIGNAYRSLREALDREGIDIDIRYSAEYRMDEQFLQVLGRNEIIPMPKQYILIENSFLQPFWELKDLLFDLQLKGFTPILAHPERYGYYHNNREVYEEIHGQGCLFQVNLLSIGGYYDKTVKNVSEWLMNKGLIDFFGSDLHHQRHAEFIGKFIASRDFRKIQEKVNPQNDKLWE